MSPNISEFSYGYALTEELIHWHGTRLTAAPVFPSLIREGRLGYDLRLDRPGVPLFLQFKLSHCMVRNTAAEIRHYGLFPNGTVFYRMHLWRRTHSAQHQLLLDLENAGNDVSYVAPAFHEPGELDNAYFSHDVRDRSVFIRPSFIGPLPDNADHHVAFVLGGARHFLSEPKEIAQDLAASAFARSVEQSVRKQKTSLQQQIEPLANDLINILRKHVVQRPRTLPQKQFADRVNIIDRRKDERPPLETAAYLSRTFLGCELLLVTEVEEPPEAQRPAG